MHDFSHILSLKTSRWLMSGMTLVTVLLTAAPHGISQTKVYRGSIGGSNIEMHLNIEGNKVDGTYTYDRIGENLKLTGKLNAEGGLELAEFGANRKQSGKIMCKRKVDELIEPDCVWSRADGTHQAMMTLQEQNFAFTGGMKLVAKTIIQRRPDIVVSYPQLASDKPLSAPAQAFNQFVSTWFKKFIKDLELEPLPRNSLAMDYNVLLGSNDLISFEVTELVDNGGAHPNNGFSAITYDLIKNREVKIEEVLKTDGDYKTVIGKYVVADIQRRDKLMEQQNAKNEGREPQPSDEPVVSLDQLPDISGFAVTPKGLMIYFDFPNVISVFDRNLVPYGVLKDFLQPNSPASRFQ